MTFDPENQKKLFDMLSSRAIMVDNDNTEMPIREIKMH